jgi:ATP-dependent Clp protease, protease subunit
MSRLFTMRPLAAGRVLSAENERKIREARDGLDAVLAKLASEEPADRLNRAAGLKRGLLRLNADAATDSGELLIYGDIGGWFMDGITAQSVMEELAGLEVENLDVRINSGGGLVFEGLAIYNAIARHDAKVTVHIDSLAASIASVIAMAGDEIRIAEGAHVMIHKPWSGAIGDANTLRKEAEVLDQLEGGLIDIYAARTGRERADLQKMVDAETWFTGSAAVDEGFADVMVPAKKKKAALSAFAASFRYAPKDLFQTEGPDVREVETYLRDAEGLSIAQAKRVASMLASPRDVDWSALRDAGDDGMKTASDLAAHLSTFTQSLKKE